MYKFRQAWLVLGWVWVAVVVYLSLSPHPPQPIHLENSDKLEHMLAYGLLMLWFCQVYRRFSQLAVLALLLIDMGISMEYLQRMTGYRDFDYADMLANVAGVLLGWLLALTRMGQIGAKLGMRYSKAG